jgi:hypothetical protein
MKEKMSIKKRKKDKEKICMRKEDIYEFIKIK